jgi:hypothetical protein
VPPHITHLVLALALGSASAKTASATPPEPLVLHVRLAGKPRMVVEEAIHGAIARLARPECRRLFTELADEMGTPLSRALERSAMTAQAFLANLRFVNGDGSRPCRSGASMMFTRRGGRVIFVCAARFADRFARQTVGGELLVLHELLHALGLGENPPASHEITAHVRVRCAS